MPPSWTGGGQREASVRDVELRELAQHRPAALGATERRAPAVARRPSRWLARAMARARRRRARQTIASGNQGTMRKPAVTGQRQRVEPGDAVRVKLVAVDAVARTIEFSRIG